MNRFTSLLVLALVTAGRLCAQDAPTIELKNKSSFKMEGGTRTPFWPIGWKPSAKMTKAGTEHTGVNIPVTAFSLTSVTFDRGTRFAIINGTIVEEGQQFGLQLGNQTFQITVKSIGDGKVTLDWRDQDIVVLLRRK
jgi:hypothetical protein